MRPVGRAEPEEGVLFCPVLFQMSSACLMASMAGAPAAILHHEVALGMEAIH